MDLKKHFQYFKYLLRHKWYVFLECLKLDVPIYLAIIHDWQKFLPAEWNPYVWSFYGPWQYNDRPQWLKDQFDAAWLHHQHCGPHHWQYWILKNDSGTTLVLEMPDKYRREMLADWRGASRAQTGKDNTPEWYEKNKDKIVLGPETKKWIVDQIFGSEHD